MASKLFHIEWEYHPMQEILVPVHVTDMDEEEYQDYRKNGGLWAYHPFEAFDQVEQDLIREDYPEYFPS